jgi:filamentous hemagglutinin family protein
MQQSRRSREQSEASRRDAFAKHPLAIALAAAFVSASGSAWGQLPTGPAVVNGTAGIVTNGSAMTITNSPSAVVNWKTFSIGAQNSVHFQQQNAASQVLNRVVGNDPSSILGSLSSNGGVWLVNPHGVLFGSNARIDVGGLVASTLAVSNDDFLGGRFKFESTGPMGGQVLNQGAINTTFGGRVWLMGDSVRNEGLIRTPGGNIVLAAGKSIELVDSGMPNVTVRVTAPENEALNLGSLIASAGSIDLHGGVVNQQGIVRADSVGTDAAGRVVIKAQGDVKLGDSSMTSASSTGAGAAGTVLVQSATGTTSVSGHASATSSEAKGGQIQVLGKNVGLFQNAIIDSSGAAGGGEVLVGGDYQGKNPSVANASAIYLGPDATVKANSTHVGDGGKVILWGNDAARVYGTIEAKGGPGGGNGGFVETSGGYLDARPRSINAGAPHGTAGTWLLDPYNITIVTGTEEGDNSGYSINRDGDPYGITSISESSRVSAAAIVSRLNEGTNVEVRTGDSNCPQCVPSTQAGDIVVQGSISSSGSSPTTLTLAAHNDITIKGGVKIESTSGPLSVILKANSDGKDGGGVTLNHSGTGVTISTRGGNIQMTGAGLSAAPTVFEGSGIEFNGAVLDAGNGDITLSGVASGTGRGVLITGPVINGQSGTIKSSLSARNIDIQGQGDTASGIAIGLANINAAGTLSIRGDMRSFSNTFGVRVFDSATLTAGSGILVTSNDSVRLNASSQSGPQRPSTLTSPGQIRFTTPVLEIQGGSTVNGGSISIVTDDLSLNEGILRATGPISIETSNVDIRASSSIQGGNVSISASSFESTGSLIVAAPPPGTSSGPAPAPSRGNLSITTDDLLLRNTRLEAQGSMSLSGTFIDVVEGSQLRADGPMSLSSNGTVTLESARLISTNTGDAITISTNRFAADGTRLFEGANTGSRLSTPNGRWLIYAGPGQLPTFTTDFAGLDYSFVQFSAPAGTPPERSGIGENGVLLADPLSVQVKVNATRPYDQGVVATFNDYLSHNAPTGFQVETQVTDGDTTVQGTFNNKNAGVDKPIGFSGQKFFVTTSDEKPVFGNTFSYVGDITPLSISAAGITATNKVYDANRTATLAGSLSGVIAGDDVRLNGATGLFDNKNVGTGKTVTIAGGSLAGADAANYTLTTAATTRADITPKPVIIGILAPVAKEYDATAAASLAANQYSLDGVIAGDTISIRGPLQGTYDSANVGTGKTVTVSGPFEVLGVDASNYSFGSLRATNATFNILSLTASGNVGTITPATLTYNADPAARLSGLPIRDLTGIVTGFKGADSLATATSGSLAWSSSATAQSPPGSYAIEGEGLTAGNYVFTQAPANSTALSLIVNNTPESPQQQALESSTSAADSALRTVVAAITPRGPGGGVFDISSPAAQRSFGPINIASMSQDELARLLEARKDFKRKLFADAIYKLEIDPTLADVQPCANVADAASGLCRITTAQLEDIHAKSAKAQPAPKTGRARTASLPQIERKIAVLFGINDYADKKIPRLENAVPDVEAISKMFAEKLGYEVRVIKNPKKADIISTLNQLSAEIDSSDSVVVYYAGHGYSLDKNGAGYWLPSDAPVNDPSGWVSNSDVATLLAGIRSRQMALISDSCYSGAFARDGMASVGRGVTAEDVLTKRSVVVLSSGGDEPVSDEGKDGHSIFAWNLMKAVGSVEKWRPGSTIFDEVQLGVKKEFPQTPKYGSVTSAGHQQGGDYLFELR